MLSYIQLSARVVAFPLLMLLLSESYYVHIMLNVQILHW